MNNSSGFIDKIRKDLIFTNVPGETWEELLRSVAARLYAAGVVNEGYADALVKREISYPTGLPIGKFNLALPHTYPQYICEYAVVIAASGCVSEHGGRRRNSGSFTARLSAAGENG